MKILEHNSDEVNFSLWNFISPMTYEARVITLENPQGYNIKFELSGGFDKAGFYVRDVLCEHEEYETGFSRERVVAVDIRKFGMMKWTEVCLEDTEF